MSAACPFAHWWFLPLELRRRLRSLPTYQWNPNRSLPTYQWNPNRSQHLSDGPPRCKACKDVL